MDTPTQAPPPTERKSGGAVLVWYTDETNAQVEHAWYDATLPEFERAGREIGAILTIFPERVAHIRVRDASTDARP
jgi:Trk K+ transport system NAD-binding subunit